MVGQGCCTARAVAGSLITHTVERVVYRYRMVQGSRSIADKARSCISCKLVSSVWPKAVGRTGLQGGWGRHGPKYLVDQGHFVAAAL